RPEAQKRRLAYCLGDDSDVGVCRSALARVCSASGDGANPFSDLCTATGNAYASVRADFATNCSNGENDGADCSVEAFELPRTGNASECDGAGATLGSDNSACMVRSITVAACANQPFSANCKGVDTFDGARAIRLGVCVENNGKQLGCAENDGFTANEITCIENPFTADVAGGINCGTLLTALGDANTLGTAQDNLITYCTGADVVSSDPRCDLSATDAEVTACLANPFGATCATELGATHAATAQNNIISLCTGADADGMNSRCMTIATTTACLANPFAAACDATALGSQGQLDTARSNVLALCVGDAITNNGICTALTGDVKNCLDNPFETACDTTLGSEPQATAVQDNLIDVCTGADADGSNPRCAILNSVPVTTCLGNPFEASCDTTLGSETQATMAQNNLIALCTGADADVMNTVCTTLSAAITCISNPFDAACDTALGSPEQAETAQNNLISLCSGDGADGTNPRCTIGGIASALTGCLRDPFINHCDTTLGATQA
ncbi:MAG: hypothetical protein K8953_13870, partial [Proteobacteria bacterium]|nr:hypothetical protein [Pseudomonadota bacterium]